MLRIPFRANRLFLGSHKILAQSAQNRANLAHLAILGNMVRVRVVELASPTSLIWQWRPEPPPLVVPHLLQFFCVFFGLRIAFQGGRAARFERFGAVATQCLANLSQYYFILIAFLGGKCMNFESHFCEKLQHHIFLTPGVQLSNFPN